MLAAWQGVLDRHAELFADIEEGASVAVVPRRVVKPVCDPVPMLLWVREPGRMAARSAQFSGFKTLSCDMLLVANDGTLEDALEHDEPLAEIKKQLRAGGMLFMVLRRKEELREHGWEDFLEWLGLPFLGSCR